MGRPKKSAPIPPEIEPEEISQEVPEDEPERFFEPEESIAAAKTEAGGKAISGAEAVRQAMADGLDAPADIQGFVKSRFGLDIPKPMISSYKSQEKARQLKKAGSSPAPAPEPSPQRAASPVARASVSPAASGGIIADIGDIKRLLATHGKDGLEELIKVLS